MTLTVLEPFAIEHLDFDPTCETSYCGHGRPKATHILILPCPCKQKLACTPCAEHSLELKRIAAREYRQMYCNHCGPGKQYSPYEFQIESLP